MSYIYPIKKSFNFFPLFDNDFLRLACQHFNASSCGPLVTGPRPEWVLAGNALLVWAARHSSHYSSLPLQSFPFFVFSRTYIYMHFSFFNDNNKCISNVLNPSKATHVWGPKCKTSNITTQFNNVLHILLYPPPPPPPTHTRTILQPLTSCSLQVSLTSHPPKIISQPVAKST